MAAMSDDDIDLTSSDDEPEPTPEPEPAAAPSSAAPSSGAPSAGAAPDDGGSPATKSPPGGREPRRGFKQGEPVQPSSARQLTRSQVRRMVRIQLQLLRKPEVSDGWIDALFDEFDSDRSGALPALRRLLVIFMGRF